MSKYKESEQQSQTRQTNFVYHSPKQDQPDRYQEIRDLANELSQLINENCPPSRELF